MAPAQHVTVGIVGGGVASLTLANILEQSGISYMLWEARDEIAPQEGAGIGLMPNGLRILDQLGLIREVEEYAVPHDCWEYRDGDGTLYNTLTAMRSFPAIFGYDGYFMERQRVLQTLFGGIKDKTWIKTSRRVSSVQNFSTHAVVTASDGSQVSCDFVAGADGVRSVIRRQIEAAAPAICRTPENFSSKYACVYGISTSLPQIPSGRNITVHQKDVSMLIFSGKGGTLFWLLFQDLKTTFELGQMKRFTADDIAAVYAKVADTTVTAGVKFSDMYRNKTSAVMTALEEGVVNQWSAGRLFVLGDSAHKMVPHAAMGANHAMESAACFASNLLALRNQLGRTFSRGVPEADVESCLHKYAEKRQRRVSSVIQAANFACLTQLKIGPAADAYICSLPTMKNEQWLALVLHMLSDAEKIEGWGRNGARVNTYTENAQKIREQTAKREKLSIGQGKGGVVKVFRKTEVDLLSIPCYGFFAVILFACLANLMSLLAPFEARIYASQAS